MITPDKFIELAFAGKLLAAFGGGLLSFVSPCVLPLVPSYISFITGVSFEELSDDKEAKRLRKVIIFNSIAFILGFSFVFVGVLGLSAQLFGNFFLEYKDIIRQIGGVAIFLLGIHVIGIINVSFLQREKRLHFFKNDKPQGFISSFIVGVGFAAGWTPCIGPILSAVFAVAASSPNKWAGMSLFIAYSLGLAVPFFLTALGINSFLRRFQKVKQHMGLISTITGALLIVTGILIFFDMFSILTGMLSRIMPSIG